jgi:hypothetical protein
MSTNLFRALQGLLPKEPLQVLQVTAVHGDGTCTVQHPGGGQQRVRGSATEGDAVFVRAGLIEGTAPALSVVTVEV